MAAMGSIQYARLQEARDLIKDGPKMALPPYWKTRQKLKAVLVWTQNLIAERIEKGE